MECDKPNADFIDHTAHREEDHVDDGEVSHVHVVDRHHVGLRAHDVDYEEVADQAEYDGHQEDGEDDRRCRVVIDAVVVQRPQRRNIARDDQEDMRTVAVGYSIHVGQVTLGRLWNVEMFSATEENKGDLFSFQHK